MVDVVSRVRNKLSAVQRAFSAATESIADIRKEIDALRAERARIATAPLPAAEVVTQFDAMLNTWACAGQAGGIGASIDGLIADAMVGNLPQIELHQRCTLGHVTSLLTFLFKPLIRETLVAKVEAACAESPAGLPAAERQRELARLDEQLLALERAEEQALQVAEVNGLSIDRREDADPRVVLGIAE